MALFKRPEHEKWASRVNHARMRNYFGIPAMDPRAAELYGRALPRGVGTPRLTPDRPPVNGWMAPSQLAGMKWVPGQIILGKIGDRFIGHIDDRPMVTIAGARAGKTSTVLEPNLYLYPGSCVVLDPKGELTARTAPIRRAIGHKVIVLDPFKQSGEPSASFNALAEIDPASPNVVDDTATLAQALVVDDGDPRSRHWNDNGRKLIQGLCLLTLQLAPVERHLVTVRELLSLNHPRLAVRPKAPKRGKLDEDYYDANKAGVEHLLAMMANAGPAFGGVLQRTGRRFLSTPHGERGSFFSTAATSTDYLDSLPMSAISIRSDFALRELRAPRPTTIYLCLPVGRMESHFRWLRLVVQLACTVLEQMGIYPRERPPILFMMEEFATLGHMDIMERAAAYFPGFGVKLWAVLQDITQLERHYSASWETFLGNAGLLQCFANGDQKTLTYLSERLARLIMPFEIRTAFRRDMFSQLLMFEGEPPAAAIRLEHDDVALIRSRILEYAEGR